MSEFKNVKAWIGGDERIHLSIIVNTTLWNGQKVEMEIHDATLPLSTDCPANRESETLYCGIDPEERFYLVLDSGRLYLNKDANGNVYTVRTLHRKMTKTQIEKELGYTVEIIPDESEKEQKND